MKGRFLLAPLCAAALACMLFFSACGSAGTGGGQGGQQTSEATCMYIYSNGNRIEAVLEGSVASSALVGRLEEGDVIYAADDYGGFEKVGALGFGLPVSDERITARAGDIMLYNGNQIVIFYGTNSWAYTRLGRVTGLNGEELKAALGEGTQTVRLSLK